MLLTSPSQKRRDTWADISHRFTDDRDCLASFLALHAAEVLAGEKPGNLFNIVNRPRACGKNLYRAWKEHGLSLIEQAGLTSLILRDDNESLLLYVYDVTRLNAVLAHPGALALLRRSGYQTPPTGEEVLSELQRRISGPIFPHEIGIFLGYPLKDVAAFIGYARLPFACQAAWRIYGNPTQSLELAERFVTSRRNMATRLKVCKDPLECLVKAA